MNTLLTDTRHEHQQHTTLPPLRRLSPMDRAALHLGLALIRWSRRPGEPSAPRYRRTLSHEDRVRIGRQELVRAEQDMVRLLRLP